jgi:hypothetical protein
MGTRDNGNRQPTRKQGAGAADYYRGPARGPLLNPSVPDIPEYPANTCYPSDNPAQQVGMIHPSLHSIRAKLTEKTIETHDPTNRYPAPRHCKAMHFNPCVLQLGAAVFFTILLGTQDAGQFIYFQF